MLAGLPQSPSLYNPLQNPRRRWSAATRCWSEMAKQGYASESEVDDAIDQGIDLNPGNRYEEIREPYFFDFVEQQLIEEYGVNTVRRGGLKVQTTIDPQLQEAGREAIENHLYYSTDPSSAVVSIDPDNGYVKAMASSGSYSDAQFNLAAQGHRQPGSAAKTWALTTAVRRGIDPDSTYYTSQPLNLNDPSFGHWEVQTYSDSYAGSVSLHQATLASDNTVFAQLALDLGPDAVADTAHDMGIETELDGLPAETLGGLRLGVSPLEMTNAYATLASGGIRNKPIAIKKVTFPDGHVDELGEPERERVFSDGVAYEVTQILEDNVDAGTGTAAGTGCGDEAGKTGTTDDFNDAMFMGYTPHLATGVWVGYPDALISMTSVHGISVAGGTFPADDLARLHVGRARRPLRVLPRARGPGRLDPLQRRVHLELRLGLQLRPRSAAPAAPRAPTAAAATTTAATRTATRATATTAPTRRASARSPRRSRSPEPKPQPQPPPPPPPPPPSGGVTP